MAQPLYAQHDPAVEVHDDHILIAGLTEDDPEVVHALREVTDPEQTVHQLLRVGARATRTAGTSIDLDLVQRSFETLNRDFANEVTNAVQRVTDCADGLVAEEDGALTNILTELRTNLVKELDDRFDEDSKTSVIGKLDALLDRARDEQHQMLRRMLDPSADGPLANVRDTLAKMVKDHVEDLRKDLKEITTKLAVDTKEAEIIELTTVKGFKFEDLLDHTLGRLAAPHGDMHEHVGNETGELGTKRGDAAVTLNLEDTGGQTRRFVLEAKDGKVSMRKILDELDQAMDNRGAEVAIAVFSSQNVAPTGVPFHIVGNRAIAVLDKATGDDTAVQLAYLWARWMLRRDTDQGDELDPERIKQALEDAHRALTRVARIKGAHSSIRKKVDEATSQVAEMTDELEQALSDVADLL